MTTSRSREDLKTAKPSVIREAEVFINVAVTYEKLIGEFTEMFRKHGLSPPQYNVLRILNGAGERGLPCSAIADRMINRVPDITRLVDRLENKGLLQRRPSQKDRRVVRIVITSEGKRLLRSLRKPVGDLHRRQLAHLTRREQTILNRLLEKARNIE